jgi:hypothetical protein
VLAEALIALASAGGTALAQAATTDAWQAAKAGFARLLGRGGDQQMQVIEGRLESTRTQLQSLSGQELAQVRDAQAAAWTIRLQDLLEESPDAAGTLQQLLDQLAAVGVPGTTAAGDHGVAVGGNLSNTATLGGVAAGVIHGGVATSGNPSRPGADQA